MTSNPFARRRELWKQRADLMRQMDTVDDELKKINEQIILEARPGFPQIGHQTNERG